MSRESREMTIREAAESSLRDRLGRLRGRKELLKYVADLEHDAEILEGSPGLQDHAKWAEAYRWMAERAREAAQRSR